MQHDDCAYLETVDELGQRDILTVTEDVDGAELLVGTVLELEPQELASIGGRSTAELNGESRAIVGYERVRYSSARNVEVTHE